MKVGITGHLLSTNAYIRAHSTQRKDLRTPLLLTFFLCLGGMAASLTASKWEK